MSTCNDDHMVNNNNMHYLYYDEVPGVVGDGGVLAQVRVQYLRHRHGRK